MLRLKKITFEKVIPPKSALAFIVKKGQYLRIIDIEGKQVGDFVLFNGHDHTEKISSSYTRSAVGKWEEPITLLGFRGITTGNKLVSTTRHPMMTITADTEIPPGIHDFTGRLCSSYSYVRMGVNPTDGCLELLTKVLAPYGIVQGNIPDPMNVFMNIPFNPQRGMFYIDEPVSRPCDYVEFRAEMDCLCALSACPDVFNLCNGRPPHPPKPLKIQILVE